MKGRAFLYPLFLVLAQIGLCAVAFKDFRMHPDAVAFCSYGDGMKNNYSLLAYVKEPVGPMGFFHYNGFHYPYGDAIWYTDATPLFAVVFKWLCLHVHDWSGATLSVFNWIILLNIPMCALLVYAVFRRWLGRRDWALAAALVLPWINPMILRIPRGHYNLSFSSFIVGSLLLLQLWQEARDRPRRRLWLGTGMALLVFLASTWHGYYLPILGTFLAACLVALGLQTWRTRSGKQSLAAGLAVPAVGAGLLFALVRATDPWLALRTQRGMGYDWMETKIRFTSLFSAYEFMTPKFPVRGTLDYNEPERAAYLGLAVLALLAAFGAGALLQKRFRDRFVAVQHQFFANPLRTAIAAGGALSLAMAFGEKYYTDGSNGLVLTNVFNPFLYLHPFVHAIENFRAVGRFVWPFWFVAALWTAWTALQLWKDAAPWPRRLLAAGILVCCALDAKSIIDWMQGAASSENALSRSKTSAAWPRRLQPGAYQALLPIPFYTVGSEDLERVLDDRDDWSRLHFQWAVKTGLPLVASKMSRTPPVQTADVLRFVAYDSLSVGLRRRLDDRPVLVAVNRDLTADSSFRPVNSDYPVSRQYYLATLSFAARHGLRPIDSAGPVLFYAWHPPPLHP